MHYKKLVFAAPGKVELQEDDLDLNSVPDGQAIIKTHRPGTGRGHGRPAGQVAGRNGHRGGCERKTA